MLRFDFITTDQSVQAGRHVQEYLSTKTFVSGYNIEFKLSIALKYSIDLSTSRTMQSFTLISRSDTCRDINVIVKAPGPRFTKKTPSYWYRDSNYKPETVVHNQ